MHARGFGTSRGRLVDDAVRESYMYIVPWFHTLIHNLIIQFTLAYPYVYSIQLTLANHMYSSKISLSHSTLLFNSHLYTHMYVPFNSHPFSRSLSLSVDVRLSTSRIYILHVTMWFTHISKLTLITFQIQLMLTASCIRSRLTHSNDQHTKQSETQRGTRTRGGGSLQGE